MGCGSSSSVRVITVKEEPKKGHSEENGKENSKGNDDDPDSLFTQRQKQIVKKTWLRYLGNDLTGRGCKVFFKIFQLYPAIKDLFPSLKDIEGDALLKNIHFKGHASRFMQAVGAVVENMDSPTNLSPLLIGLGKQHIRFPGFAPSYFDAFTVGMTYVWEQDLGRRYSDEVATAWRAVFDFIMGQLRLGYDIAQSEALSPNDYDQVTVASLAS